jgi:hypothetical protein
MPWLDENELLNSLGTDISESLKEFDAPLLPLCIIFNIRNGDSFFIGYKNDQKLLWICSRIDIDKELSCSYALNYAIEEIFIDFYRSIQERRSKE